MFKNKDFAVRPCAFCGEAKNHSTIKGNKYHYNCPRCGKYEYFSSDHSKILDILNKKREEIKSNLDEINIFKTYCSYVMHAKHFDKEDVEIHVTPHFAESLTKEYRAFDVLEQIDNFIFWLCAEPFISIPDLTDDGADFFENRYPWFGCATFFEAKNLLEMLQQEGFVRQCERPQNVLEEYNNTPYMRISNLLSPTLKAYELYEQLKKGKKATNKAFLALQFKGDLNQLFKNDLKKAVSQTGFILSTVDEEPKAGLIDDKIRLDIRNSRFVIADLTDGNKGAYWEAGFAEGMGKPVIYMCQDCVFEDGEKGPHFDVSHHQCITWSKDKFDEAVEKLKNTIRYTFPDAIQEDAEEE